MPEPGASSKKQKQDLSLFGQLYYQLCDHLGISGKQLALRADISPGTISRASRLAPSRGTTKIERTTAEKLYETMQQIASEQGLAWDDQLIQPNFLRVAGYSTEEDQTSSYEKLEAYLQRTEKRRRKPPPKEP